MSSPEVGSGGEAVGSLAGDGKDVGNSDSRRRAATQRQDQIRRKSGRVEPHTSPPKFVADVMLGRLARWLRIAGFDVLYSNSYADDELVALSEREERILLSRDTRLLVRRSVRRFVFLESEKVEEQLRQVLQHAGVKSLPALLTRCLECNEPLESTPREAVRDRVPPFVYQTQPQFKICPRCRRIYWAGTHRQAVTRTLERLLGPDSGES